MIDAMENMRFPIGSHVYRIEPANQEGIFDLMGFVWIVRDGQRFTKVPLSLFVFGRKKTIMEVIESVI